MGERLADFFSYKTENRINKAILYCKEDDLEIQTYTTELLEISLREYIDYVCTHPSNNVITTKDVVQFSDFNNATEEICKKIKNANNPGMKFEEIGRLLLDDDKERKESAYIKYGENHIKTATSFGLAFEFYNTYYLSCIGSIFVDLNDTEKKMLLDRLIVRSTLFSRMIQASQNGTVHMREFLYMLAYSTYIRRKSNIKKVLDYLYTSNEYNFDSLEKTIEF